MKETGIPAVKITNLSQVADKQKVIASKPPQERHRSKKLVVINRP